MKRKALLALALFSAGFAQEVTLEEVEVEAAREVVLEETIRELPAKDVGEALEFTVPGIWKIRKGAIANDIILRGFKKDEVNQLFDGARVYNACPNRMDPGLFHVDFEEVKEIEVIKGPFDVRNYGAVGGTVNVVTKEPKKGFSAELNFSYDSWAYVNPSLSVNYGTDEWGLMFGYSYRFSKPYEDGRGWKITELYNQFPPNTPMWMMGYDEDEISTTAFNIHTGWAKMYFRLAEDLKLKVSYAHQKANDVLYPYLMMDAIYDETDRGNVELLGRNFKLQLYASSVRHWMTNQKRRKGAKGPLGWTMGTWAVAKVYGLKGEYRWGNFAFGLDAFYRNWDATTTMFAKTSMAADKTYLTQHLIPDVDLYVAALYGEYKKRLSPKLRLVAGLRLDYARMEANPESYSWPTLPQELWLHYHGTSDTSQTDVYPSGNVQLLYQVREGLELFVGLGSAVRVPDPQERYTALDRVHNMEKSMGDWVGNPNLDPERNTELDVGLNWQGPKHFLTVRTFFSYVSNYIYPYKLTATPTGDSFNPNAVATSYTNIDAYFTGFELSGTYAVTPELFLDGGAAYVYARKKDTYPDKNIYDKDVAEIPPLTARLALRYDKGSYFGEVETLMAATQYNVDSDLNEQRTSGWAVVNLKAGGSYKGFKLLAGVRNLFDKYYYTHLSYLRNPFSTGVKVPEPGRTFYVTVSYRF
ncbi:MAG: TonB-dependent receptor [Aquificae bacterium]|nr:TonB-dependent receptor [Aquificota bacterium]